MTPDQYDSVPAASTKEEWRKLLESDDPRIVRGREDWDRAMADDSRRNAILPNCDEETVRAFSEGLKFNNGGLAGADYSMLEDTLTLSEFRAVWEPFAIGTELFTDYMDYSCVSHGDCAKSIGHICTGNC